MSDNVPITSLQHSAGKSSVFSQLMKRQKERRVELEIIILERQNIRIP